jgi:hypothetical protein
LDGDGRHGMAMVSQRLAWSGVVASRVWTGLIFWWWVVELQG